MYNIIQNHKIIFQNPAKSVIVIMLWSYINIFLCIIHLFSNNLKIYKIKLLRICLFNYLWHIFSIIWEYMHCFYISIYMVKIYNLLENSYAINIEKKLIFFIFKKKFNLEHIILWLKINFFIYMLMRVITFFYYFDN